MNQEDDDDGIVFLSESLLGIFPQVLCTEERERVGTPELNEVSKVGHFGASHGREKTLPDSLVLSGPQCFTFLDQTASLGIFFSNEGIII